ncbi:MAG TPA: hypothetical protein VF902_05680 [Coriobacteriia bacterium]
MHGTGSDGASASKWRGLYRTGGVACLVMVAAILIGAITYMASPPPTGDAAEWFALFDRSGLLGMMDMDLVMLVGYLALIPVVAALYALLHRRSESVMALAAVSAVVAIATHFASSRVFEMLALSRQYAVAATEAQRTALLAAGQSMLTTYLGSFGGPAVLGGWNFQGTAFNVSYVLWSVVGVAISVVILHGDEFGRAVGWIGIVSFAAALGLFLPMVGVALSLVSVVLQLAWFALVARGLFRAARLSEVAS